MAYRLTMYEHVSRFDRFPALLMHMVRTVIYVFYSIWSSDSRCGPKLECVRTSYYIRWVKDGRIIRSIIPMISKNGLLKLVSRFCTNENYIQQTRADCRIKFSHANGPPVIIYILKHFSQRYVEVDWYFLGKNSCSVFEAA